MGAATVTVSYVDGHWWVEVRSPDRTYTYLEASYEDAASAMVAAMRDVNRDLIEQHVRKG